MTAGQDDAAMIHHLRCGQCWIILGEEFGAFDECAAAGRTPIRNRFFGEHRSAMTADSFHSFKSNGSGCAAHDSIQWSYAPSGSPGGN